MPALRRGFPARPAALRSRRIILSAIIAAVVAATWYIVTGPLHMASADTAPLSQGRPVTASSIEGQAWPATAAVDGDKATRWSSAFSDPQWLRVDLGAPAAITRVDLSWEAAYATAFDIQLSTDAASWTTVYHTDAGTGGAQTLTVSGTGRYVRMYGTKRATGYGYSLFEFQVFGTAGTAGTPPASSAPASQPASAQPSGSAPAGGGGSGYVLADPPVTGVVPSTANPPHRYFHEFQANCAVSHHAPDDPIVFPNLPGASHDHTFMGNITTNAATTTGSLRAGETLCKAPGDRSGYWMPSMYNGDRLITPEGPQTIYYKTGVNDYTSVRPFPPGLRYVVGSPKATADEFHNAPGYVAGWECGDSYHNLDFPATCPAGDNLNIRMQAPSCWDGLHLDTPDHKSHMAYPTNGVCPADHPVAVPMIEFKMAFPAGTDLSQVRLSSGRGYSFHYDFFNAWDPATLAALVKQCVNGGMQCDARGYDETHPDAGAALDSLYEVKGSEVALDRTGWTVTASATGGGDTPARMLDGNADTRWTSGTAQAAGQSVIVDMHASHPVNQISMLSTGVDFPHGYRVFLSTDGQNWGSPVSDSAGFMPAVTSLFATATSARYIKVQLTQPGATWWSIAEFTAYTAG